MKTIGGAFISMILTCNSIPTVLQVTWGDRWQLIDKETITVLYSYRGKPVATGTDPVKAGFSRRDLTRNWRKGPVKPSRRMRTTRARIDAFSWHVEPSFSSESVPCAFKVLVAIRVIQRWYRVKLGTVRIPQFLVRNAWVCICEGK